ncbi:ABC transporter ATP-binding protein [Arthrobacter sp. CDRTa11]|uniref:ABC transporter ATP-binding protein n=1 Tax=Arthrobacter sp. CDRTa11 TaxID=2651199 RepID=UPI002265AFA7|nr:ATP-binding cassette domain-containing protein [Arthrobacter sp. CDRTa11]
MRLSLRSFGYPDSTRPVLADVDLAVRPGGHLLVAGGSGSGKTTLGLILGGVLPGQHRGTLHGSITLNGHILEFPAAQAKRIDHQHWGTLVGYAGQDAAAQLSTVAPTVAEEIAFPLENAGMARDDMRARVQEVAADLGLTLLLERDPGLLSGGQQKLVALAAAIAPRPRFLVLDEPLAGLDLQARMHVTAAIAALLSGGMGVVVLSQDLAAAGTGNVTGDPNGAAWAPDQVVLLAEGRAVFTGAADEAADAAWDLGLPVLRAGAQPAPQEPAYAPVRRGPGGRISTGGSAESPPASVPVEAPVLAAEGLRFAYGWRKPRPWRRTPQASPVLEDVGLTVNPGECVAVAGANGSGKSTLLRLLTGLSTPQSGTVLLRPLQGPEAAGSQGSGPAVGALLQHPLEQLFERTVRREVGAGLPGSLGDAVRGERVEAALRRTGLLEAGGLHPYELPASGQRLTALAALLAQAPRFIALDEPTVSLDRHGLDVLAEAIAAEAGRGAAVVMVTHDLDFAYRTCSRLLVLSEGRLAADGPFGEVLQSHFSAGVAFGVAAPAAWRA